MKNKLFGFMGKHPVWVILVTLSFAIIAASGAQKLTFKNDYRVFFGDDNPQLLESVASELGLKLKAAMKAIAVEQLRIK